MSKKIIDDLEKDPIDSAIDNEMDKDFDDELQDETGDELEVELGSKVGSKKDKNINVEKINVDKSDVIELDSIKVRFKREIKCFFGEKYFYATPGEVKKLSKRQYDILKQNPNNIELVP